MPDGQRIDLTQDVVTLTERLVDIESVSGGEGPLADAVEAALGALPDLDVRRIGHTVMARTDRGLPERVVLAGHLDTVPANDNLPSRRDGDRVYGLGACDMKGGCAVGLRVAATVREPTRDVTFLFYECEEVAAERNGLAMVATHHPDWLKADFAVLMEPTSATVEGGCQGTVQVDVRTRGVRAHTARAWMGENAIHKTAEILRRLGEYEPRRPEVDGLTYHEGLNAVRIEGGVAGNVLPDEAQVRVNFRYAPDRSEDGALAFLREFFVGFEMEVADSAPAARPGLDVPAAAAFVAGIGKQPRPKHGWTDVARFAGLGIPAVNYGPGDPLLAHSQGEFVEAAELRECEERVRAWLGDG
ncbi:MAG: succinyl-diaminopimelate desuccinylase [Propionibacteriales bacterium]|nr:succinyl-diaminopimelate desuccinylase [Propionibacteriales bacterium]